MLIQIIRHSTVLNDLCIDYILTKRSGKEQASQGDVKAMKKTV